MENQFLSDTQMKTALVIGQLEPAFVEQLIIDLHRINCITVLIASFLITGIAQNT